MPRLILREPERSSGMDLHPFTQRREAISEANHHTVLKDRQHVAISARDQAGKLGWYVLDKVEDRLRDREGEIPPSLRKTLQMRGQ